MNLSFVPRSELSDFEWDSEAREWNRPTIDSALLKKLNERSAAEGFFRVVAHAALLVGAGWLTVYAAVVNIALAIPPFLFFAFLVGFLNGIEHEMRHGIVFPKSLKWFSDFIYFLVHILFRQGTRYQTISHRTHHRFTMVRGVDPETDLLFPEIIDPPWVRKTLRGLAFTILSVGIPSFFQVMWTLTQRVFGRIEPMIVNQASAKDVLC